MRFSTRRSFLVDAGAVGALPLFNIGGAHFGESRALEACNLKTEAM